MKQNFNSRVLKLVSGFISITIVSILLHAGFISQVKAINPVLINTSDPAISFMLQPANEWLVYEGDTYDFSVKLENHNENTKVTVKAVITGPLGTPENKTTVMETFVYESDFTHYFKLNPLVNEVYLPAGDYELKLEAIESAGGFITETQIIPLTDSFSMSEESNIEVTSAPSTWNKDSGEDYKVDFTLKTVIPACVILTINGKVASFEDNLTDGNYSLTWDGKINEEILLGNHEWALSTADTTFCNAASNAPNLATGSVTVVPNAAPDIKPIISNAGLTIDPFSPNGDGVQDTTTLTFNLNTSANVTVEVRNSDNVLVRTLKNAESASAGNVNIVWNGKETGGSTVPDGTYTIKVLAENGGGADDESVSVMVMNFPELTENCAGFTDLEKTYKDCEQITYAKALGAMTGHADGTFRPDEELQRDQIAKIALVSFFLFDEKKTYCGNALPFPDISGQWSKEYVCRGFDLGMITGYKSGPDAGKFIPAGKVNWSEFLALILRNIDEQMPSLDTPSYPKAETGQWYSGYAAFSMQNSLYPGTAASFDPLAPVSRLDVARVLYRLMQLGYLEPLMK